MASVCLGYKSKKYIRANTMMSEMDQARIKGYRLFCGFSLLDRIEINKCIGKNRAKTRKITEVSAIDSKNFDFAGSLCYTDDALKEGLI